MNINGHVAEQPRTVRQGSYGDGYDRLVFAIARLASSDVVYGSPSKCLDAIRFFESAWFETLTGLDGDSIICKLLSMRAEKKGMP